MSFEKENKSIFNKKTTEELEKVLSGECDCSEVREKLEEKVRDLQYQIYKLEDKLDNFK